MSQPTMLNGTDCVGLDLAASLKAAGEAAYCWDIASDRLEWSANAPSFFAAIAGPVPDSGRRLAGLIADNGSSRHDVIMADTARPGPEGAAFTMQYRLKLASPNAGWVEETGRWFAGADGKPARVIGVVRAIDERHEAEEALRILSEIDPLTGTLNQNRLLSLIDAEIIVSRREKRHFALLLASVDNLSTINAGLGFSIGDEALKAVTARLSSNLRGRDSIGRFTGNKFAILLRQCDASEMAIAAQRFIDVTRAQLITTSAGPVTVSLSVGGVVGPRTIASSRDLLAEAHEALSEAKAKKRGLFIPFDPQASRSSSRRADGRVGEGLIKALNERRIALACQPIVHAGSRLPYSYEALMRVEGEDGDTLPPGLLVPVAERLGLCGLLDHRVLELGLDLLASRPDTRISVNISAQTTSDREWLSILASRLVGREDLANRLVVEMTESAAIQDIQESVRFLEQIKSLGCRVAIDDFGAGHTSFRYLREMKVDSVKIDGSYITNLANSLENQIFVRTMINLARELGIRTVAEWVGCEEDALLLESWGINYMQGHFFGEAIPSDRLLATPLARCA